MGQEWRGAEARWEAVPEIRSITYLQDGTGWEERSTLESEERACAKGLWYIKRGGKSGWPGPESGGGAEETGRALHMGLEVFGICSGIPGSQGRD